jgi:hypothetical protein
VKIEVREEFCPRELTEGRAGRWDDIIGVADGPADLSTRASEHFHEDLVRKHGGD